jgi:hypothetical protein
VGSQIVVTYQIDGKNIDVVGCWDEETLLDNGCGYDFFDFWCAGEHLNEGDAYYSEEGVPTKTEVADYLEYNADR